jgi:20S proteasome alpha/beta subunit
MRPNGPSTHTQSPIVTGTSVVALKFKDGVVIAADNLGMLPKKATDVSTPLDKHIHKLGNCDY